MCLLLISLARIPSIALDTLLKVTNWPGIAPWAPECYL